jgi:TPR repeat protein
MYNLGEGVAQNYQEAMRWSKLAAAQGHTDAQFNIGWMYDKGQGVEVDKKLAKHWYKIACDNGHEIGCEYLRKMKRR